MERTQQNDIFKGIIKRLGITILCCIPALVLLGFWLQELGKVATVSIFSLFLLVAICIEEYIHIKIVAKKQVKQKVLHKNQDVFK